MKTKLKCMACAFVACAGVAFGKIIICALAAMGTLALWADSDTCIVSGWPVADRAVSSYAESSAPLAIGCANGATQSGDIDLNRRTRDVSDGGDIDGREFIPGFLVIIK